MFFPGFTLEHVAVVNEQRGGKRKKVPTHPAATARHATASLAETKLGRNSTVVNHRPPKRCANYRPIRLAPRRPKIDISVSKSVSPLAGTVVFQTFPVKKVA